MDVGSVSRVRPSLPFFIHSTFNNTLVVHRPLGREPPFSLSRCARTRNSTHLPIPRSSLSSDYLCTQQCSNFTCCGLTIPDMHDLLAHFEDSHLFVLSKQASATDPHPSSVLASRTSSLPLSHQNDYYDPEPFVLSYPQPRALPSPSPTPTSSTFLGVYISSGSRPSTPELSAAGSFSSPSPSSNFDSDPISSSPSSAFSPLSHSYPIHPRSLLPQCLCQTT